MKTDRSIRLSKAFCSARDRNIPVLVRVAGGETPEAFAGGATELASCLDYGVRCTGWLCPLFSLPTLPPEELLKEAIQAERERQDRTLPEGKAILDRAVREGRARREEEARRNAARRRRQDRDPSGRHPRL